MDEVVNLFKAGKNNMVLIGDIAVISLVLSGPCDIDNGHCQQGSQLTSLLQSFASCLHLAESLQVKKEKKKCE